MATQPTLVPEPAMAPEPKGLASLTARYIRFGPFELDRNRQEVCRHGNRLKLQGKVYQVLLALIEKQGETVTRDELRARLWPADTQVNYDANVNTTVNKLRQALGDSTDKPLYIETIPRKGYCLIVTTEFADERLPNQALPVSGGENPPGESGELLRKRSTWIAVGVIMLILAGMLVGIVITRLWIAYSAGHGALHQS